MRKTQPGLTSGLEFLHNVPKLWGEANPEHQTMSFNYPIQDEQSLRLFAFELRKKPRFGLSEGLRAIVCV